MHGDAADAVSADFDLTEMYPGADPQVEPCDTSAERTGTGDGPGRAVERREHPVPGPIDDPPLESADLALGHVMVPVEEPTPLLVAKPRGKVRRSDDVREEHRRERAVDVDVVRALAGDELLDPPERLVAHHVRQVVGSLQQVEVSRGSCEARKRPWSHGTTRSEHGPHKGPADGTAVLGSPLPSLPAPGTAAQRAGRRPACREMPGASSLDHFVGALEHRLRNRQPEGAGGLEVDHQLEPGGLLDR
jgi:hypothetical protein